MGVQQICKNAMLSLEKESTNKQVGCLGSTVIQTLTDEREYKNRWQYIFVENLFCSVELYKYLRKLHFGAYRTVRSNRRRLPPDMKVKIKQGKLPIL